MCGLIYAKRHDHKPVAGIIAKRYKRQAHRGSQGFGYLTLQGRTKAKRALHEHEVLEKLEKEKGSEILFHHRYPTSTENVRDATHPILVANPALTYTYYLAHNGIIVNDDVLKKAHEAEGFTYRTVIEHIIRSRTDESRYTQFNDSEALALDFALTIEGKQEALHAEGSIAFIAVQLERKTKKPRMLYYGRNAGSPLTIERHKNVTVILSEGGSTLEPDTLYWYHYETQEHGSKPFTIGKYTVSNFEFQWNNDYRYYDDEELGALTAEDIASELMELYAEKDELAVEYKIAKQAGEVDEEIALYWELDTLEDAIQQLEARINLT